MKIKLLILLPFFILSSIQSYSQNIFKEYSCDNIIIPKQVLVTEDNNMVIPFSITENNKKKAGILFLDESNNIKDAVLFEGEDSYVINQVIESDDGNLLIAAEGYSIENQESVYFIETDGSRIVNDFIYNEGGNELDPFSILETKEDNILIGGFIKNRKLVSSSFYNMFSEEQMIYIGEFNKTGNKIWSQAIRLEGYNEGICNKIIKAKDEFILLCHAHKIDGDLTPFIIRIDKVGNVKKIVKLSYNKNITQLSDITYENDFVKLIGTYKDNTHYFSALLSDDMSIIRSEYVRLPSQIIISNSVWNNTAMLILGTAITEPYDYNFLLMKEYQDYIEFNQFGSDRFDYLVGSDQELLVGYHLGGGKSSIVLIEDRRESITKDIILAKKDFDLISKSFQDYKIINQFKPSNINKGFSRVNITKVKNRFRF